MEEYTAEIVLELKVTVAAENKKEAKALILEEFLKWQRSSSFVESIIWEEESAEDEEVLS